MGNKMKIWNKATEEQVTEIMTALEERIMEFGAVMEKKKHRKVIDSIQFTLESEDKIIEKLTRNDIEVNFENARENLKKLAVMTIICYLPDDTTRIVDALRKTEQIVIEKEKDYVKKPKKDGYRGYHLNTRVKLSEEKVMGLEIQIHTLGVNYWIHMQKQMKPIHKEKQVKELKACIDHMIELEQEYSHLF